jgi:hypothetical protein
MESDYFQDLINRPTESLSIELKGWINPDTPEGVAKIVKAAIAMRNHGGGYLLIGFHNNTCNPDLENVPSNVVELFHQDKIQRMISEHASELFEVKVHFPSRDGNDFPVIEIGQGVKNPIATKKPLRNEQGELLFQENKVFIRSLAANNTPSTTEATWKDWPRILDVCFDNREADIARFIRRHLRTLSPEVVQALFSLLPQTQPDETGQETPQIQPEDHVGEATNLEYLQESATRFDTVVEERNISLPDHGTWEVAVVIVGAVPPHSANLSFLNLLDSSNPNYTGWPVWLDSRGFIKEEARPYVFEESWEAFIHDFDTSFGGKHLDFWRLNPSGKFYLRRILQDDLSESPQAPEPMTKLDFVLVIIRVAEAIAVALEFAKAMGCSPETTRLSFIFKWTKIKGRELSSWANIDRVIFPGKIAYQDEVTSQVSIPLETPSSAVAEYVHSITAPLFAVFNGMEFVFSVTEDLTKRLIERRL